MVELWMKFFKTVTVHQCKVELLQLLVSKGNKILKVKVSELGYTWIPVPVHSFAVVV